MANLVDTSVNGDLRVTGTMFGTQAGNYATCATAAGTAAKTATISGFTLTTGIHVFVKFTVTNTAAVASLTLNVSGTGAKAMKYRGGNLPAVGTLSASRVYEFIYDGTNWELVGDLDTNTQTVTGVKGNAESSYRTGQVNITPANIGVAATTTSVTVGDTTASIPQATTTTPKMDGTAAVGSETTWAKGDHVHPTDTSRAPTSHASSATTYGVGTTANYGHVKLDNSTPLTVGTTSTDGVATGKAHIHNALESVARASVASADLAHIHTNTRAHMILSQISNSTTTHKPASDGYILSFMWDNSGPYDTQIFIPNGGETPSFGRLQFRSRGIAGGYGDWGDWRYLSAAATSSLLTSADDLNNIKGDGAGNIIGYYWESTSTPSHTPFTDNHGAQLLVFGTSGMDYCIQVELRGSRGIYQRKLSGGTWGDWEKVLVSSDITTGSANGTISVAGSDVAVKGLGGAAYLNTGTASGTVATGNHTHTTSIASDSSSGTVVTLAHNTQYKLTAGGTSVLFKTPTDSNTDTKVTQTADNSSTGTGFEVLFSATADNTTRTEASRKSSKLTFQPSTGTLTATKFSGPLTGNVTGNCSGSSGSCTGNAATATSATNVALVGTVKTTSTTNGDTIQFQAGSGTAGTVTIVNAKHAASADSATSASSASKVANKLTLKIKTGTTEGTDLYTYDGSGAKTLDIKQGSNITLTAAAGSLTIAGTADTKNTAGSTDTSSKIFLIGATSQAANPQTYSQDTTYVDTDATLASTKFRVAETCTLQYNSTDQALDFVF